MTKPNDAERLIMEMETLNRYKDDANNTIQAANTELQKVIDQYNVDILFKGKDIGVYILEGIKLLSNVQKINVTVNSEMARSLEYSFMISMKQMEYYNKTLWAYLEKQATHIDLLNEKIDRLTKKKGRK